MFRALEERQASDLDGGPAGHQYCLARVWLERMGLNALLRQGSSRVQDKPGNIGTPMLPLSGIGRLSGGWMRNLGTLVTPESTSPFNSSFCFVKLLHFLGSVIAQFISWNKFISYARSEFHPRGGGIWIVKMEILTIWGVGSAHISKLKKGTRCLCRINW